MVARPKWRLSESRVTKLPIAHSVGYESDDIIKVEEFDSQFKCINAFDLCLPLPTEAGFKIVTI